MVGMVQVHPNSRKSSGRVRFEHRPAQCRRRAVRADGCRHPCRGRQVERRQWSPIVIEQVSAYPAQPFHPELIGAVGRAAESGHSHMPAVSGAGHDAVYMARLAPAGMIFIPCKDGISRTTRSERRARGHHRRLQCAAARDAGAGRGGVRLSLFLFKYLLKTQRKYCASGSVGLASCQESSLYGYAPAQPDRPRPAARPAGAARARGCGRSGRPSLGVSVATLHRLLQAHPRQHARALPDGLRYAWRWPLRGQIAPLPLIEADASGPSCTPRRKI